MRFQRSGIVLISILVLTLLVTFFLGALVKMNPGRLRRTVHDENRDRALMAARAGTDYALNRFRADTDWKADENGVVIEMDDLVVREDHGNVLGWIRTDQGSWAGFRCRFNYQDGPASSGKDDFDDPSFPIYSEAISLNNLGVSTNKSLPVGDGPGFEAGSNGSVSVPGYTVAIVVEGIAAPGLDPSDPRSLAQAEGVTTRTIEGIYAISNVSQGLDADAVLMAGGGVDITVGDLPTSDAAARDVRGVLSLQSDGDNTAGIRVKGEMDLVRGQGGSNLPKFDPDENAQVLVHENSSFRAKTTEGDMFVGGVELADDPFLKLEWDRVKDSDQSEPIELPAGVYFFSEGSADGGRSTADAVGYYPMTWTEYRNRKMGKPGTQPLPPAAAVPQALRDRLALDSKVVTLSKTTDGGEVEMTEKRDVITFEKDVKVVPNEGVSDLVIVPERGARQKAVDGTEAESEVVVEEEIPTNPTEAVAKTALDGYVLSQIREAGDLPGLVAEGPSGSVTHSSSGTGGTSDALTGLFSAIANKNSFVVTGAGMPSTPDSLFLSKLAKACPGATFEYETVTKTVAGVETVTVTGVIVNSDNPGQLLGSSGSGTPTSEVSSVDELYIPKDEVTPGGAGADDTVPQDIEIVFAPDEDSDSAFIRSEGDIFLGTHLSGKGGGVIARGNVDIVGYGVNLQAKAEGSERDGVAIFGKKDINISTYDERRNKYWDVNLAGSVFTEGNLSLRLGQDGLKNGGENPPWGIFDYEGVIIALGDASGVVSDTVIKGVTPDLPQEENDGGTSTFGQSVPTWLTGNATMIARGIRLFYDPRYLAPYSEDGEITPTFAPLSVVER